MNITHNGEDEQELDHNEIDDGEVNQVENVGLNEVIVGSAQRPITVRLANINELCFVTIEVEGHKIMERRIPEVIRFNRNEQRKRKLNFYSELHANLERNDEGDDIIATAFNRFINR